MCTGAELIPLFTAVAGAGGKVGSSLIERSKKNNPGDSTGGSGGGDGPLERLAAGSASAPLLQDLNSFGSNNQNFDLLNRLKSFGGYG